MDELLKALERRHNALVSIGVVLVGGFIVALVFSFNSPSDILQALATLLGSALSGGVAAIVAIIILKREETLARDLAAEGRQAREKEIAETEKAIADWMVNALLRAEAILARAIALVQTTQESESENKTMYRAAVNNFASINLNAAILDRVGRDRPLLIPMIEDINSTIEYLKKSFSGTIIETPHLGDRFAFRATVSIEWFSFFISWTDHLIRNVELFALANDQFEIHTRPYLDRLARQINTVIELATAGGAKIPDDIAKRNAERVNRR